MQYHANPLAQLIPLGIGVFAWVVAILMWRLSKLAATAGGDADGQLAPAPSARRVMRGAFLWAAAGTMFVVLSIVDYIRMTAR